MPANDLDNVKALIQDSEKREFFRPVVEELQRRQLDSDDLVSIIVDDLGYTHWFKSKLTEKWYPGTTSDYYSVWIDECHCAMFIKLLITDFGGGKRVVVTSFKKDDRYA